MVYQGLSRTVKDYQGLSRTIKDCQELSWTVMDYHGLSGTDMDCHELSWTILDQIQDLWSIMISYQLTSLWTLLDVKLLLQLKRDSKVCVFDLVQLFSDDLFYYISIDIEIFYPICV